MTIFPLCYPVWSKMLLFNDRKIRNRNCRCGSVMINRWADFEFLENVKFFKTKRFFQYSQLLSKRLHLLVNLEEQWPLTLHFTAAFVLLITDNVTSSPTNSSASTSTAEIFGEFYDFAVYRGAIKITATWTFNQQ